MLALLHCRPPLVLDSLWLQPAAIQLTIDKDSAYFLLVVKLTKQRLTATETLGVPPALAVDEYINCHGIGCSLYRPNRLRAHAPLDECLA